MRSRDAWSCDELGREHLQRDGARQVPVDRAEDLAHAAAPEQALEGVAGDLVARAEMQSLATMSCAPCRRTLHRGEPQCNSRTITLGAGDLLAPSLAPTGEPAAKS